MDKDSFLANVEKEGSLETPEIREEGKETPPAPPAETKPREGEPAAPAGGEPEGGGEPKEGEPKVFQAFHKHPRWIALNKELQELRDFRDRAAPLLEGLEKEPASDGGEAIPQWFIDLFGENADAWAKYRQYTKAERDQFRSDILAELRKESAEAQAEVEKWDKWVDEELSSLVSDEEIASRAREIGFNFSDKESTKAFRNELLKAALDWKPSDEEGNISLKMAFDILEMQKLRKEAPKGQIERKRIADQTMAKPKGEAGKKDYMTPADLAGKGFRDLIPDQ